MKVIGNGYVHFFEPVDECPHSATPEPLWQESWVVYFWDVAQQVYMFLRLSQEPNRSGGFGSVWVDLWTPSGNYKYTDDSIPLATDDRTAKSFSTGKGLCSYAFDGTHTWTVNTKDARIKLVIEDDHVGLGYFPEEAGAISSETSKHHIEATGQGVGHVEIGGERYDVRGMCWRDHSWGKRDWYNMRAHRFFPALFGEKLNLFFTTFVGGDGKLARFGTIIRNGSVEITRDFTVTAFMMEDGVTNRGGTVEFTMDSVRRIVRHTPVTSTMTSLHREFHCADCMCEVRIDGIPEVGVGVAETSNRAQGGAERPMIEPPHIVANGVYAR